MEKEKEKLNTRLFSELVAMTFFIAVSDLLIQALYGRSFQELLIALTLLLVTLVTGIWLYFQKAPLTYQRERIYLFQSLCFALTIAQSVYRAQPRDLIMFLIMMVCFPTLIVDDMFNLIGYLVVVSIVFIIVDGITKPLQMVGNDALYVLVFTLLSSGVAILGNKTRRRVLASTLKIKDMARRDSLTQMYNRSALDQDSEIYLGMNKGILGVDVDNLKLINEIYGHNFGDQVIKSFAQTFTRLLSNAHTYRYHDDLLVAIVDAREFDANAFWKQFLAAVQPVKIGNQEVTFHYSGSYIYGKNLDQDDLHECLRDLDFALKEAKTNENLVIYSLPEARHHFSQQYLDHKLSLYRGDDLTKMLNMEAFYKFGMERLPHMLAPVIIYMNFRNFKGYNDRFGREAGDQLLISLGKRIHEIFKGDLTARFYGDHFYILTEQEYMPARVEILLDHIHGLDIPSLSLVVGISFLPKDENNIYLGCDNAKFAADFIKKNLSQNIQYYNKQLARRKQAITYVDSHFDEALANHEIKVFYQPIVRAISGAMCNAEALSRWHRDNNLMPPVEYISILESLHLIYKLDLYVLNQVLQDLRYKLDQGLPVVPVSINLSGYDFDDCDIVHEIISRVDGAHIDHDLIVLEITESIFVASSKMQDYIDSFHKHGFKVWMDDFGSGYSSLNMLKNIDVDLVKLDMKFMKDFDEDEGNRLLVGDIIAMASRMGIETLAEGVESKETFETLIQMGCAKIQGYYISKPIPLKALLQKQFYLALEKHQDARYFDAVSQVNLEDPFARYSLNEELAVKVPPTAVVELVDDTTFYVLRANKEYYQLIHDVNFTKDNHKLIHPLSDAFMEGLHRCFRTGEWESIVRSPEHGFYMNSLVHIVSRQDNRIAFIIYIPYIQSY